MALLFLFYDSVLILCMGSGSQTAGFSFMCSEILRFASDQVHDGEIQAFCLLKRVLFLHCLLKFLLFLLFLSLLVFKVFILSTVVFDVTDLVRRRSDMILEEMQIFFHFLLFLAQGLNRFNEILLKTNHFDDVNLFLLHDISQGIVMVIQQLHFFCHSILNPQLIRTPIITTRAIHNFSKLGISLYNLLLCPINLVLSLLELLTQIVMHTILVV